MKKKKTRAILIMNNRGFLSLVLFFKSKKRVNYMVIIFVITFDNKYNFVLDSGSKIYLYLFIQ